MPETIEHTKDREATGSRVPLVAEVLGYVGASLVLTAGWVVMEEALLAWDPTVQMIALCIAGILLFVAGLPFRAHLEEALSRMTGVLWVLSAGLMLWSLALLFNHVVGLEFGQAELALGLTGGAYAGLLLVLRRGSLQQIPLYVAGAIATLGFAVTFGPTDHFCNGVEPHWLTPSIIGFGGLWFGAARAGLLQPTATALALGCVTLLGAPLFAVGDLGAVAPLIGLVAAVAILGASVILRRVVLLVCGALGLHAYLNWAVPEYLGGSLGTPIALLVAGLGVLAVALVAARRFVAGGGSDPRASGGEEGEEFL